MTGLELWTVYDHPRDMPDWFVARRFVNDEPQPDYYCSRDLEGIRFLMRSRGLTRIPRQEGDDAVIVEVWV